jgi:hypothetical protein
MSTAKKSESYATVKVPKELIWRLKAYAAKHQMRLQEAVRTMLEQTLKNTTE